MSGFPQPVSTAAIVAAGALLTANNLSELTATAGTARTNLGLGTAATQAIAAFDAAGAAAAAQAAAIAASLPKNTTISTQTNDYSLVLADLGTLVQLDKASAINLTVPTNASQAFAVGAQVWLEQIGAGQVTVVAAGGVTINRDTGLKISAQWKMAALIKTATDTWDLIGALAA